MHYMTISKNRCNGGHLAKNCRHSKDRCESVFYLSLQLENLFAIRSQGKQEHNEKLQMFSEYIFELMKLMCQYSEIFLSQGRSIFLIKIMKMNLAFHLSFVIALAVVEKFQEQAV